MIRTCVCGTGYVAPEGESGPPTCFTCECNAKQRRRESILDDTGRFALLLWVKRHVEFQHPVTGDRAYVSSEKIGRYDIAFNTAEPRTFDLKNAVEVLRGYDLLSVPVSESLASALTRRRPLPDEMV